MEQLEKIIEENFENISEITPGHCQQRTERSDRRMYRRAGRWYIPCRGEER